MILAAGLSFLTPSGSEFESPSSTSQSELTDKDDENTITKPIIKPSAGGIEGGNKEAVQTGRLPGYEEKEINTDPESFCYLINSEVVFDKPDAVGNIMIENNPGNICPMQLSYYIEGTDQLIYTSAMIYPNEYVSGDKLLTKLKKGQYDINAVISVYDADTMELKTSFYEKVTLTINNKFLGLF